MDVFVNFISAYQDKITKKIVLEGRAIAMNYINYYFWIDALSSVPDRIIFMRVGIFVMKQFHA
jgi:hypothetical protein